MFLLDLKRAEVALKGGRLEEARRILSESPDRNHRDAQHLVDRLVTAFLQRAEEHLQHQRLKDAAHDAEQARTLGGRQSGVAGFLARMQEQQTQRRQVAQQQQHVLQQAEQQYQQGALTLGALFLQQLPSNGSSSARQQERRILDDIALQRLTVEDAAQKIQREVQQDNHLTALRQISSLSAVARATPTIQELTRQILPPLQQQARLTFTEGRLDQAQNLVQRLQSFGDDSPESQELQRCLVCCRQLQNQLAAHRYDECAEPLSVLQQLLPQADWVREYQQAVERCLQLARQLRQGPVSLLTSEIEMSAIRKNTGRGVVVKSEPAAPLPVRVLPDRCLLQIDEVGRLLLLRTRTVSVGGSTGTNRPDVALLTDSADSGLSIRRDGHDYLAEAEQEFQVNGQAVRRRLLTHGDSIAVGSRGRLRFRKPVAASGSAVLQVTGAQLPWRDIRNVVLMADSLLFGPPTAHFPLTGLASSLMIGQDDTGLFLRDTSHRHPTDGTYPPSLDRLVPGIPVIRQNVRFVLQEAPA